MNGVVTQEEMDLRLQKWQRRIYLNHLENVESLTKTMRSILTDKETAKAFIEMLNVTVLKDVKKR